MSKIARWLAAHGVIAVAFHLALLPELGATLFRGRAPEAVRWGPV